MAYGNLMFLKLQPGVPPGARSAREAGEMRERWVRDGREMGQTRKPTAIVMDVFG